MEERKKTKVDNKIHIGGKKSSDKSMSSPVSLTATSGDASGEIDLTWEPVALANSYLIQKSKDLKKPLKWSYEDVVTKSSYTITKLRSGRCYWFRVAAVGSKGQSPWSSAVQKKAP